MTSLAWLSRGSAARRVWIYLAITFAVSWTLWLPVIRYKENPVFLNLGGGPAIVALLMVASEEHEAGRNGTARLRAFLLLAALLWLILVLDTSWTAGVRWPLRWNPWLIVATLIPAWIISGAWSAGRGVRQLMTTLVRPPNWRWPAVALVSFPLLLLASAALGPRLHLPVTEPQRGTPVAALAVLCAVRFVHNLAFTAVFEEPGWRGFLLPELERRFSPLVASIFVWLPWAAWHAPLDFSGGIGSNLALWVQVRLVYFLPISILLTWLYHRSAAPSTGTPSSRSDVFRVNPATGGLLGPAVFHAAINVFPFLLPYSPPMLGLIFVWAAYVVVSNRMWRRRDAATLAQ